MKRLLALIVKNPLSIFTLLKFWVFFTFLKIKGWKTVVYNMHQDYFFDLFKDIYDELRKNSIEVYFSIPQDSDHIKDHLLLNGPVPDKFIISNKISPFIPFDMFICAEVTGPDFPFKLLKNTKKVEIYHGTGVYNLYEKGSVLSRFDVHFAVGPMYHDFLKKAYEKYPREHSVYNVGYPKTDRLFKDTDEKLKKKYNPENRKTILYAPHWNENGSLHAFNEEIITTLSSFDATVLVKPHNYLYTQFPERNWKEKIKELEKNHDNIRFITEADTQLLYPFSDIMITDTGTTAAFEYSLLHKPLVVFKEELWFNKRQHVDIEKAIIDTALCFTSLTELKQILSDLSDEEKNLKFINDQKKNQIEMTEKYLYNIGKATETAVDIILKELGMKK